MANGAEGRWLRVPINLKSQGDTTGILHISDLHFTGATSWKDPPFSTILADLEALKVEIDVVACTGDLIDSSIADYLGQNLDQAHKQAREFLLKVCETSEVSPENGLFVVPGNHDSRFKGIVALLGSDKIFFKYFGEFFRSGILPDAGVAICSFDSNGVDRRVNMATGVVEDQEFTDLRNWLSQTKIEEDHNDLTRIALLHHHPMPIAETESRRTLEAIEFLILKNSGTFMREMLKAKIDLILHGHQHFTGYTRASFRIENDMREVGVVAAGSIGKLFNGIYSYNVIGIPRRGRIHVQQRVLNVGTYGPGISYFIPDSYAEWRHKNALRLAHAYAMNARAKSHSTELVIDSEGDLQTFLFIRGLEPIDSPPLTEVPFPMSSAVGSFDEPCFECINDPGQHLKFSAATNPSESSLIFEPKLGEAGPLDINARRGVYNAFCFYKEDRKAATDGTDDTESATASMIRLYESLCLTVQINGTAEILDPRVCVLDREGRHDEDEERYCRKRLSYNKSLKSLHLGVDHPLPGCDYSIVWNLPERPEDLLPGPLRIVANSIEEALSRRSMDPAASPYDGLVRLRDRVAHEFDLKTSDLDLALMCRDFPTGALRVVVASQQPDHPIYAWRLRSGQGLEGQAFKRRTLVCGIRGNEMWRRHYQQAPTAAGSIDVTKMIYALPLSYPINSDRVVALLRLSSTSSDGNFLKTADDVTRQNQIARAVTEYYIRGVLSFAGLRGGFSVMTERGELIETGAEELLSDEK